MGFKINKKLRMSLYVGNKLVNGHFLKMVFVAFEKHGFKIEQIVS